MLRRVCLLVNYNLYESKRHFTKKLAEALQRKGIMTRIIDVAGHPLDQEMILEITRFAPDLMCTFNSFNMLPDQTKYIWDVLEIPNLSILVDPALYSISLTNSPYSIISCVDRDDCDALRSYRFQKVFFWPHAVEPELHASENSRRPLEVVFLGSCSDYESLRKAWQQQYPSAINQVLDHAIEIVLSDKLISLAHALVMAWNASKLPLENVDFMTLFSHLDNYTRGRDRIELIRAITDVPVHIFGQMMIDQPLFKNGWEHYLSNQSNVVLHPPVDFKEAMDILKQSKICLNSMPFFKNGSHERIFAGLACGALPVTTYNRYIAEEFTPGKEIIFYHPPKWDEVNQQIASLLQNEPLRQECVTNGRAKVMQRHTWDQRVDQLLEELPKIFEQLPKK